MDIIPIARQTQTLPAQSLLTKDGKQVGVAGVVIYSISDTVATLSKNFDTTDTIGDVAMTAITQVITQHAFDYLLENLTGAVQAELTSVTRKKLRPYGVRVFRAAITDFSRCLVIKNLGGPVLHP